MTIALLVSIASSCPDLIAIAALTESLSDIQQFIDIGDLLLSSLCVGRWRIGVMVICLIVASSPIKALVENGFV